MQTSNCAYHTTSEEKFGFLICETSDELRLTCCILSNCAISAPVPGHERLAIPRCRPPSQRRTHRQSAFCRESADKQSVAKTAILSQIRFGLRTVSSVVRH